MTRVLRAEVTLVAALALLGCSDARSDKETAQTKPTFDWGYPEYSQYDADGKHVGTTLYQQDPACQRRLSFYDCAFIDAKTPDDPTTNPTGASTDLTGGLDSCTSAITEEMPSYCMPADVCNPTHAERGLGAGAGERRQPGLAALPRGELAGESRAARLSGPDEPARRARPVGQRAREDGVARLPDRRPAVRRAAAVRGPDLADELEAVGRVPQQVGAAGRLRGRARRPAAACWSTRTAPSCSSTSASTAPSGSSSSTRTTTGRPAPASPR